MMDKRTPRGRHRTASSWEPTAAVYLIASYSCTSARMTVRDSAANSLYHPRGLEGMWCLRQQPTPCIIHGA
eukprot:scaffold59757_cov25-Tisochrysis_lutea.AAC.1